MAFTTKTDFWRQPFINDPIPAYATIPTDVINYEHILAQQNERQHEIPLHPNIEASKPNKTSDFRTPAHHSRPVAQNYAAIQNEPYDTVSKANELQREISILRTNNEELAAIIRNAKDQERTLLNQERAQLERDRRDMENHFNTEHGRLEEIIHNERCQLAKERSALELKIRELRPEHSNNNNQSDELDMVKKQLASLQRELEARCKNEADAAYASQQRVSRLEEELRKMRETLQSNEQTIVTLETINARSAEVLKRTSISEAELIHEVKSVEKDYDTIRRQLSVAENAIDEYEQDIQGHIETISELNETLSNYRSSVTLNEKRMLALDSLENDVNMLQMQLSSALEQQMNASKSNQALPMSENVCDLVAAVKLTLLYVQNKLTSRETMGRDAELEKLKAELFDLRDTLDKRDSQTSLSRQHSEDLKKSYESLVQKHCEELELLKNQSDDKLCELKKEVQDLVSSSVAQYKEDLLELRGSLQITKSRCSEVIAESKISLCALAEFQEQYDSQLAIKTERIESLENKSFMLLSEVEQSRESLSVAEIEHETEISNLQSQNDSLRNQINTLNYTMSQLDSLVLDIEREREASKSLQDYVQDIDRSLVHISSAAIPLELAESVSHTLTSQLETETKRNDELQEKNLKLQNEVDRLKKRLEDAISREAKTILVDVGIQKLSSDLHNLKKQNEKLSSEKMELIKIHSSGDYTNERINSMSPAFLKTTQTYKKSICNCNDIVFEDINEENSKEVDDGLWQQFCKIILENGISFLTFEQLRKMHKLIYLAAYHKSRLLCKQDSLLIRKKRFIIQKLQHDRCVVLTELRKISSKGNLRAIRRNINKWK